MQEKHPPLGAAHNPGDRSRRERLKKFFLFLLPVAAVLVSCMATTRAIVSPPQIAGASFVGSADCSDCHEKITKNFSTATHAKLHIPGEDDTEIGCESCHGPGSVHTDIGGGYNNPGSITIVNPRKSPEVCLQCHLDARGAFSLPNHHPVMEGQISCVDCHDPHQGPALRSGGTALLAQNDVCTECHTDQRGPYGFEHEAVRDGCTTCHDPHGSVNPQLLKSRNANLCLQCHFQEQPAPGQIYIGGQFHSAFLSQGTCWTAGCHEAVHGSHVNFSLRY